MTEWILIAIILVGGLAIVAMLVGAVRSLARPASDSSQKFPFVGDGGAGIGAGGEAGQGSGRHSGNWFSDLFGGGDGGGGFDGGGGGGDGGG